MAVKRLTARRVATLAPGANASESLGYGLGALQVRGGAKGPRFFYRYGPGQTRILLPAFTADGAPVGLAEARTAARAMAARAAELAAKGLDLAETIEREREAAARTAASDKPITFAALLTEYVALLEARGALDWRDARGVLNHYAIGPFPKLAKRPAAEITLGDVLEILQSITAAGSLRTAAKVRSYMRAAFQAAINARASAQAGDLRRFNIESNPVAAVAAIVGANRTRDRALSLDELRALWARVNRPGERLGPLLRAYLLLGGQRFRQLRRATLADIQDGCLVLHDPKGRRELPRRHSVPITAAARAAIDAMAPHRVGPNIVTLTNGRAPAGEKLVADGVRAISRAMVDAGEAQAMFTLSDLRRTVETRLAAAGVPAETRAHLQSHGLGGVQHRHYDRHDYHREKIAALETLERLLTGERAAVIPLRR